jgi:hypothetical protein
MQTRIWVKPYLTLPIYNCVEVALTRSSRAQVSPTKLSNEVKAADFLVIEAIEPLVSWEDTS